MARNRLKKGYFSLSIFTLIYFCTAVSASASAQEDNELIFGFIPLLSTEKLYARFDPLVDHLESKLGVPIRFETARDYPEFERRTNKEKRYDIIFTAPHFYYKAQREAGYKVIARVGAPNMKALFVVKKSSGISTMQDLRGKRLSTPATESLGTVLIRSKLRQEGLDPDKDLTLVATPTHNAALLTAYKGLTDAASLMEPPYKSAKAEVQDAMRILANTAAVPHMPIAISPTVSHQLEIKIQKILTSLKEDKDGQRLLKHLAWPMGLIKATPDEYDVVGWALKDGS